MQFFVNFGLLFFIGDFWVLLLNYFKQLHLLGLREIKIVDPESVCVGERFY